MTKSSPKPIISIFVHCYPPAKGGAEFLTSEIYKILSQKFDIHIFTGQGLSLDSYKTFNNFIDHENNPNIHRLNLNYPVQRIFNKLLHRFVTKFGILSHLFFGPILNYTPQDLKIIKSSDYILGIAMPTKAIWDAYHFSHKFNKKLIIFPAYHDVSYYNHSPFFQKAFNYAHKIIFLTNFEKNQLTKNYHINNYKTVINTYCPFTKKQIAEQLIKNKKRIYNFSHPTIGYVGQICARKNLFIFKELLEKGYRVVFAGIYNNGSLEIEKYYQKYIDSNQLVIHYDFPEDKKVEIFKKIDVFINPSEEESLGIVNFEAIYYGIPIILNKNSAFTNLLKINSNQFFRQNTILKNIEYITKNQSNIKTIINNQYSVFKVYNFNSFKKSLIKLT